MKKYVVLLVVAFACLSCARKAMVSAGDIDPGKKEALERIKEIEDSDEIVWLSFEEAANLNKYKPKKTFVDVYTSWCGWCKRMDKTTFEDKEVADYLNENFYSVKLNAESSKKVDYKGEELSYAELAQEKFNATGYPTTVYLDEGMDVLQPLPGFLEADMLNKILHYYGEDFYKTTSWKRFQAIYTTSQ